MAVINKTAITAPITVGEASLGEVSTIYSSAAMNFKGGDNCEVPLAFPALITNSYGTEKNIYVHRKIREIDFTEKRFFFLFLFLEIGFHEKFIIFSVKSNKQILNK